MPIKQVLTRHGLYSQETPKPDRDMVVLEMSFH